MRVRPYVVAANSWFNIWVDRQDLGYGGHSDPERILEAELQRDLRWHRDVVTTLALSRWTRPWRGGRGNTACAQRIP